MTYVLDSLAHSIGDCFFLYIWSVVSWYMHTQLRARLHLHLNLDASIQHCNFIKSYTYQYALRQRHRYLNIYSISKLNLNAEM